MSVLWSIYTFPKTHLGNNSRAPRVGCQKSAEGNQTIQASMQLMHIVPVNISMEKSNSVSVMMLVVLFAELLLTKVFSGCQETDIARPRQISKNTTATKSKSPSQTVNYTTEGIFIICKKFKWITRFQYIAEIYSKLLLGVIQKMKSVMETRRLFATVAVGQGLF